MEKCYNLSLIAGKKKIVFISLILLIVTGKIFAAVTVTAPTLTINTCSVYPTNYHALGNIVITEGNNGDFAVGTNVTLILSAPANYEFLAGTGSVAISAAPTNLSGESITVTATTITVTYTSGGTNRSDAITISGIQVRCLTGPITQTVTKTGGTGTINGFPNGTVAATLISNTVATPAGGSAVSSSANPVCNNVGLTLSVTGGTDGTAFQWQSSPDNVSFTNIAGATSSTYIYTPSATGNIYFRRIVTCGTSANSSSVLVTSQVCDCSTGGCSAITINVDLSASPDTTYVLSSQVRNGLCCLQTGTKCIRFNINVNPLSDLINFQVATPAPPGGATYQVDCGAAYSLGTPACISGGTHCIVFCKSGGDSPTYTIIATRTINASPDITVRQGCPGTLSVTGLQPASVNWTSIAPGAAGAYNSYLSCTSGCVNTTVTPGAGAPSFIDYMVSGTPNTTCTGTSRDTIRVNIVPGMTVGISPTNPVLCSAGPGSVTLTATPTGGAPPYTYLWSPGGATTQSISVSSIGTYTVDVSDATVGCPPVQSTVTVVANPTPPAPTAAGTSICTGSTATLTATAPGGTYEWYTAASGGTLLATAASYTTPVLVATTTYYVQATAGGCTGPRTAVTVTVSPIPAAPTAPGTTICQGATASLTATAPGGTYEWYDAASGGTLLFTGSVFTTPALASNTTYYVQTTISGCTGPRTAVTVTVTPTPAAPTAAGATICEGTTATLTATAPGGIYQWYDAASGGTLLITNASYTSPALVANTTYYVQTSVSGCSGPRTAVTVTVTPIPAAPTASGATICTGTSTTLTATAPGGTYAWYDAASGGTLLVTNASYTTPILAATTIYYVQTTVSGCAGPRTAVTVTVSPVPAAPTAAGASICTGTSTTLTATAPGGTYQWYDAASGGTLLVTNASYTTPVLAATTTYYVETTVAGCTGPRTAVTVTVSPVPAAPTAAGATICNGGTATLTATAPGGTYAWYNAASGGTLLITNASYTTPVLAATTTYYVQTTIAGCTGPRTAVTVTVNPIPAAPTASGTTICQGTTATITATAPGGTYEWYTAASGGTLLVTNASYTTPVLSANTTYYVQTTVSGCTGPRTAVTVTVTPTPVSPTAASPTICTGTSTTLTATAPGGTYQWYDAATGGTLLVTNASYSTPVLAATTTYYVQTTVAGCTGPRTAVTVTVSPVPPAPTALGAGICTGTSTTLTATAPGGTYQWYNASSGGTLLATNANYTTPVLAATTTYYVQTTVAGCAGPRTAVTVTVSPIPAAPTAAGATICSGSTATLTATAPGGTYEWYDAASGGTLLITNASYTSPVLTASTTYFVQTTVSGCTGPRTAVTVTVNPIPAAPTAAGTTICQGATATLTATAPGGSYQWYDAASGGTLLVTNASYTTPALAVNTTYYVQTTISGCSGPRTAVTVTVTPTPAAPTAADVTICEGTTATLSATAPGGTYQWYDAASGGTLLATAPSYTTPVLIANTTFYVQTTVSGCPGPRTAVIVTVTPTPAAPTATNATICSGSAATLTATAPGGTYEWYSAASGGSLLITNASYSTPALTVSTTYYVQTTISGCIGPRTAVTVTVNPIPAAPAAANATICDGSTATLTATSPGGTYQWYDASSGGTLLFTGTSYITPPLSATTAFYVQTTVAGCTGPRTAVTVVVNPIPAAPTASGTTICQGSTATISATAPGGIYRWYPVPTGGAILFTGANYTTPALSASTTYYVQTTVSGCTSPRTAVTVTVTPTPAAPTAAGATICEGTSTTLTATAPGGIYDWYDAASGGTLLVTNSSYTTPVIVATTTFYVQTTISGCTGPRTAVTVTIIPTDDPSFNYSSGTYCITGTNPTPIITGASSGTFSASPAGLVFSNTTTGTINLSASSLNTYSITFSTNGTCPSSSSVNITITNAPSAVFSYNTPFCQNDANAFPVFGAGASAGIFSASPAGLTFMSTSTGEIDLSASAPGTYTITNNIAAAGGCAAATANSSITINVSPQVNAGSDQTICEGTTIALNGTIAGSAVSSTWSGGSGSFSNTGSLTAVYTPGVGETSAQLVLTTNDPAGPCSAISDTVVITITPTPAAPASSGTTICEGTTATLTATSPGGTYQWYNAASGGTLLATASNYTTPVLSVSTTYYVQTTVSGCAGPRTAVTVTVTPTPAAPTAAGASICVGSSTTLTATAPGGTYEWYDAATGGTLLMTNASYTTPALSSTTTYYVQTIISSCAGPRTAVVVTVNPIPAAPTAANITICSGNTGTVTATSPGGIYQWYDAASGGTLLSTGASYTSPALTVTTTYFVQSTIAGCTGARTSVTINVNPVPVAPTVSGTTICQGTTATLSATAPGGTYRWYPVPSGGAVLFTGANYTTPVLNVSTTYYVQTSSGGCASPRTAVTVTVTPSPAAPTAAGADICSGSMATLTATAPGGVYEWYSAASGGALLVTNATYTTPVLTSTTTYYVQTTITGCAGPRTAVTVTVTPIDNASFSYSSGTYCPTGTNPTPVVTGGISGTFSSLPAGLVFVNTATGEINLSASAINSYSVIFTTNGSCPDTSSMNITITDTPGASFNYSNTCSDGPNPFPFIFPGNSAGVFSTITPGLVFVNPATGEVDLSLTPPGNYDVMNQIGPFPGCPISGAYSNILIEPSASVNAGPDRLICGSGTTTLAGSIGGAASSATWSGGTGTFSNSASLAPVYTPGAGETSAMLILTTNDPAGSCSAVSDTMIVTISPLPVAPTASGTTICEGTTATLTATAPGGTYQWYSAPTGGTALATGPNFTTPILTSTTTYYVQTTVGGCAGPRTGVAVVVTPTENSSFSYSSGTFCATGTNPSPTVPAGVTGTFSSSPAGLMFINASTGEINLAGSALNTYSVIFNTDGACPGSSTVNVTITNAPDASFSYNGPFCPGGINPAPVFPAGASAGIFSSSPAGLNFVNTSTGEINLSTSSSGTYTVTNNIAAAGGCAASTSSSAVVIDIAPIVNAGLSQTVCDGATVTLAGSLGGSASAGTWSGGAGTFSNNTDLNAVYISVTGEDAVILTLTTDDPAGTCGAASDTMTINFQSDTSAFSYSSSTYCLSAPNPIPLITGGYTGTFSSSPAGLVFTDINTGEINVSASALNTYSVTFTSNGICPNSTSVNITITNGQNASFSYSGPYCQSGTNPIPVFGAGSTAGVFSSSPAGLNFVSTSTGEIDLQNTVPGTYNIINFIAASGGCAAVSANTTVTIEPAAIINAGADRSACTGSAVTLNGSYGGAATTATWSGGLGSFSNITDPNAVYTPAAGETSVLLILTSDDPTGPCGAVSDSMTIIINPIPGAPVISDTATCIGEMVTLTATASGGTYEWYDAASGGTLLNTGASYTTPALTATTAYYVQTTISGCTGPQTMVTVTVTPSPVVNAGADQTVCSNNATATLSGTVTNAAGGIWTSTGGGTFSPNDSSLNAVYTPSSSEIASDSAVLVLTTYGNCTPVSDTMILNFSPAPLVNAGANQFICTGTMTASLNGSVSGGATTGQWSTLGSGTFAANDTMLNAVYTLSAADTTAGSVILILTSTNNGNCLSVSDTMQVAITTIPVTYAGTDTTVCGNNPVVQLNGNVTGGSGFGIWSSSGSGAFMPSDSVLNAVYLPDSADITNGNVTLMLTPINSCLPIPDSLTVTITPPTIVDAGNDTTVCSSITSVFLNGTVSGGTSGGTWSTTGNGSFAPSADSLNTIYTFGAADSAAGSVMLVLTSTNNGMCSAISDTINVTISNTTTAFAGNDTVVCANNASVTLNGTLTSGTGQWLTSGSGTFVPSDSILNPVYIPSASDIAGGNVFLTLSSFGSCTPVNDTLVLTITPAPLVNAGPDMTVCGSTIMLSGTADTIASGAFWTTTGTGTFSPNDSSLNSTYTPGLADADTLMFMLTSYGNGLCNAVTDTVMIFRNVQPSAGFSTSGMCNGQAVSFNDTSNANGGTITGWAWSFGSGGGTSVLQNPTFTYPSEGTYPVTLVVSSGTGCYDSITQMITIAPAPVVSYTFASNCQNTPVVFTDASSISSGSIVLWSWDFTDGNSSSNQHPSNTFDSSGVYNIVLTVTSDLGCSSSSTQALSVNASPQAGFTAALNCGSLSANFTDTSAISSGSISNYSWTFGDGGTSSLQNPAYDYAGAGTYTVTLIVTSNNGCSDTASASVEPGIPVTAAYVPNGGNYNVNQSVSFDNQSTGAGSYLWNFNDGSATSVATDPSHMFSQPGTYNVILVASNSAGCSDTVSYDFVVTSAGSAVPTGFTPNNDGLNDYFYVIGTFSDYELRVFNEWGNQIFISNDQSNKWDGTYQGKEQPAGTYIYIFNGKAIDGEELKMNGEVNLIR